MAPTSLAKSFFQHTICRLDHRIEFRGQVLQLKHRARTVSMRTEDALLCTNVVLTIVGPLEKTAHVKTIDPNYSDLPMADKFLPTLFAYRLADSSDAAYVKAVSRIKEGLRKVLVPFFPWAGRWIAVPGDRGRQLLCNDHGIPFIEAFVEQNLDSVVGISSDFKPVPELQGYRVLGMDPLLYRHPMQPEGLPCAFVQVTRFKCGGLVVAVTFNHMLADGESLFQFIAAWADISRTNKTARTLDLNRAAVDLSQGSLPPDRTSAPPTKTWATKCYEVSALVIESLKKEVKQRGDGAYVSTLDCIFAHHWKSLSMIPDSILAGHEIGMIDIVEGRTRFYDPPLPNLLANVCVAMTAPDIPSAELVRMPLSAIASKVREKISKTSREAWLSPERRGESLELYRNDKFLPWVESSWKSFPMYEVDFGFGTPFFVPGLNTNITIDKLGTSYVLPPTPGVRSSAALTMIRTTSQVLEALELLPDFLPFFLPRETVKTFT